MPVQQVCLAYQQCFKLYKLFPVFSQQGEGNAPGNGFKCRRVYRNAKIMWQSSTTIVLPSEIGFSQRIQDRTSSGSNALPITGMPSSPIVFFSPADPFTGYKNRFIHPAGIGIQHETGNPVV